MNNKVFYKKMRQNIQVLQLDILAEIFDDYTNALKLALEKVFMNMTRNLCGV